MEREFYTFAVVVSSLEKAFPEEADEILDDFVKMLVFDALIGNNDRHAANWGVITSTKQRIPSRFSPIFDTARGLFWNMNEDSVRNRLRNPQILESYVGKSGPLIGWEGRTKLNHFDLISLIYENCPRFGDTLREAILLVNMEECATMIEAEFQKLLSPERISLIINCLRLRSKTLCKAMGL
jgi:hypothetical protein